MSEITLAEAFETAGQIDMGITALELFAADYDDNDFSADVAQLANARATLIRIGDRLGRDLRRARIARAERVLGITEEVIDRTAGPHLAEEKPAVQKEASVQHG